MNGKAKFVIAISAGLALLAAAILLWLFWDMQLHVAQLLAWIEDAGIKGHILFMGICALFVVFLLPGVILTTGAGFLFGTLRGSLYVIVGTTIGATAAFLLARFGFRSRARHLLEQRPKLKALDQVIAQKPWQTVMLTRLIPFFPFKASNYAFGIMRISCWDFILGTAIGIIPFTLTNVYAGSIAAELAELHARSRTRTAEAWILYGLGMVILLGCTCLVKKQANAKLRKIQQRQAEPGKSV